MRILAIDFSSPARSVAAAELSDSGLAAVRFGLAAAEERSSDAVSLSQTALDRAGIGRNEIDRIAIGLGPGSYTGIRASLAFARGWQLGRGIPVGGVGVAKLLAEQARRNGLSGHWNVIVDAQRGEFYLAGFMLGPGECAPIEPLRIVPRGEIEERAARGELFLGPEADSQSPAGLRIRPSALILAELAARQGHWSDGETLEPIYLRATEFVKAPPPRIIPE